MLHLIRHEHRLAGDEAVLLAAFDDLETWAVWGTSCTAATDKEARIYDIEFLGGTSAGGVPLTASLMTTQEIRSRDHRHRRGSGLVAGPVMCDAAKYLREAKVEVVLLMRS
ncbi:MAG: hypothetical protein H6816_08265 [Phycisphaerales bacterium]|nr:hypothetical protein [Phycisphaerales bacterium]